VVVTVPVVSGVDDAGGVTLGSTGAAWAMVMGLVDRDSTVNSTSGVTTFPAKAAFA
jgi:hypothetical protein